MDKEILKYLKEYSIESAKVDKLICSAFLHVNKIVIKKNRFIKSKLIAETHSDYANLIEFVTLFNEKKQVFDFEKLIELFEFVISPSEKVVNGAVYTPIRIKDYIIKESLSLFKGNIGKAFVGDISCGCAGFLYTVAKKIHKETSKPYRTIFSDNIYGLDIADYSIERSKIILCLLAISEGEDIDNLYFNLFVGNAFDFNWRARCPLIKKNGGFDIILGNPPYVCAKNISQESKNLLANWSVSKTGNPDLYITFFQVGLEYLNSDGILGYITVNSFIKSINGRGIRSYLSENKFNIKILDFGSEQIFNKRTTYTCICIISKSPSSYINYCIGNSQNLPNISESQFSKIDYIELHNAHGWTLLPKQNRQIISTIKATGESLGTYNIKNGFATLANHLYIFRPIDEDKRFYKLKVDGKIYNIEKGICKNAIKPNILRSEDDINVFMEKLIFPYESTNSVKQIKLLEESDFIKRFPNAYNYLLNYKNILAERDKGKGNYDKWYAFGRNQALSLKGYKLMFPYISDKPYFILSKAEELFFYNGYSFISNDLRELKILQKILESAVFWFYIKNNSKPYSNNYFAFAKNHIKHFGVITLTENEKEFLLNCNNYNTLNRFLCSKYKIPYNTVLSNLNGSYFNIDRITGMILNKKAIKVYLN